MHEVWGWCHIIFHDPCVTGDFFRFPYINPKIPTFSHTHPRITKKHQGVNVIAFGHLPGIEQPVCVVGGNCSVQAGLVSTKRFKRFESWPFSRKGKTLLMKEKLCFLCLLQKRERCFRFVFYSCSLDSRYGWCFCCCCSCCCRWSVAVTALNWKII